MHAREHGGQGWTRVEWALVEEQYGRTTNAIHWHVPQAYNVWAHASDEHIDRYLRPALRGELKDAYAVTERDAGSDPSQIAATAERTDAGFRINGEKWFVTGGDHAAVYVVMANLIDGADRLPTLFVVDAELDGIEIVDNPAFTHNYPDGHPTIRFTDVEVAEADVIGGIGGGDDAAARLVHRGAARDRGPLRRGDVAAARRDRRLDDRPRAGRGPRLRSPGRLLPARRLGRRRRRRAAAHLHRRRARRRRRRPEDRPPQGLDGEAVHERGRVPVRRPLRPGVRRPRLHALQRRRAALRELRVDRIWEGTSEIQRLIVARGLERRGVERMLH